MGVFLGKHHKRQNEKDMNHKLFGWAKDIEGKTVCVSDVPKEKECGCFCPSCNAELIAKKGEVRKPHFAH